MKARQPDRILDYIIFNPSTKLALRRFAANWNGRRITSTAFIIRAKQPCIQAVLCAIIVVRVDKCSFSCTNAHSSPRKRRRKQRGLTKGMSGSGDKIKLVLMIDYILGSTGGTENQLLKLIQLIDHAKYDLYLVCLKNTPWLEENKPRLSCTTVTFDYNLNSHKDPKNLSVFMKLRRFLRNIRPDLVVCFFTTSISLGVVAAYFAGCRCIISMRRDYGLILKSWYIYPLRVANLFVTGIVANSVKVKELSVREEKLDDSRIHVIYNGIDIDAFNHASTNTHQLREEHNISPSSKVVGLVAGLRKMKHHRTFLDAAKRLLDSGHEATFALIGDGPLRDELKSYSAKLGIADHVRFLGWQLQVLPVLQLIDIGVNCSANEGLSNAIMEYMAFGVPCIVSRAGGNEELIQHEFNGLTFDLDDDEQLAKGISRLLQNEDVCRTFVNRSKEKVRTELSLEKMTDEYDAYFTKMLSS